MQGRPSGTASDSGMARSRTCARCSKTTSVYGYSRSGCRPRSRGGHVFPADVVKLQHFYHVSFEALVRSLESGGMVKAGTYEELIDRGFKVREAQRILGLQPDAPATDTVPLRYKLLAAEALQT